MIKTRWSWIKGLQIKQSIAGFCGVFSAPQAFYPWWRLWVGYWFPDAISNTQSVAQRLGLHYLVALRSAGAEFDSAAYFYWLTFWIVLPFNLIWIYREGIRQNMPLVLRAVGRANLSSGAWNPKSFTLKAGRLRFFFYTLLVLSLVIAQLLIAREPSYCKGCEVNSAIGFLLINWLGMHMALIAAYFNMLIFRVMEIYSCNIWREQ